MSWLNRPVTWKWYLGIMAASFAIGLLVGPRRAPQMPKGVDQ
jgi:hypothetical protein